MPKAIRIAALLLLAIAVLLVITAVTLGRRSEPSTAAVAGVASSTSHPTAVAVTAKNSLAAGQQLSASDLESTPLDSAKAGSFRHPDELTGAVLSRDLAAGDVITRDMLLQGIATQLRAGERALAVSVDELIGVGNRIVPGDYVDVFMSLRDPDASGSARQENTQTRLLLSRLRVLGYGDRDLGTHDERAQPAEHAADAAAESNPRAAAIASSSGSSSNPTEVAARTAVLAVPIEQAGRLLLGAHSGKLYLALRNPRDTAIADETVFAQPASVLGLRRDLDPSARATAMTPENEAYAGIDLLALAGKDTRTRAAAPTTSASQQAPRRAPARSSSGVEIIRGSAPATPLSSP